MNGKEILEGLSYIDDRFVEEAEQEMHLHHKAPLRVLAGAACVVLTLAAAARLSLYAPGNTESMHESIPEHVGEIEIETDHTRSPTKPGEAVGPEGIESAPTGTVTLLVESWTEDGFTGTVTALPDTTLFTLGEVLNVVLKQEPGETSAASPIIVIEKRPDGISADECISHITVRIVTYDPETATLYAEWIPQPKEGE